MIACRSIEFVAHILPGQAWKGNIIEHHVSRCASCRAKLDVQDEARRYVIKPDDITSSDKIWATVRAEIQEGSRRQMRRSLPAGGVWKIAACLAAAAPLVFFVILVTRPARSIVPRPKGSMIEDFRLDSVEAWGKPVSPVIYQARDSQIRIIWIKQL